MSGSTRSSFAAAGTNKYVNMNLNTAGGSKKQGLTSVVGLSAWSNSVVKMNLGNPVSRSTIFTMNQLGGVGVGKSMFNTPSSYAHPDGVRRVAPYVYK